MTFAAAGWAALAPAALHAEAASGSRAKYNFNSAWLLNVGDAPGAEAPGFPDAGWKKITLPHAWNEDSAFKVSIDDLPTGIAWYRKHFQMPTDATGKKVFLEFEGIRHGGEFYLNGEWIGRSENGIMAFGFDITDKVKPAPQENVISACIDNSWTYHEKEGAKSPFQWNDKNFYANYGGINKNVFLHVTDKLHQTLPLYSNLGTTGVYIYAKDFDIAGKSATVVAESQVKNEDAAPKTFRYEVSVRDADGKVVKTFDSGETTLAPGETKTVSASAKLDGLNFWSWGYGYLYDVQTTLQAGGKPVDAVNTRTGFRKTEFGNGLVKLNDRVIQMHGYAQRTTNEWPAIGLSLPPWMSDFSNGLMVESGGNLVRWMHVTPWKQDVESCDRVGLIQAMPAGDSEGDVTGRRWDLRALVMRDAIIYNRNNPSIVFYECGNKGIREEHMAEMKAIRDQYDPHGGRAIGSREMLDSKVAEYGGEMLYINKSAGKPLWAMEYSRDEGLRKYWDNWTLPFHKNGDGPLHKNQDASSYNRNQDSHAVEDVIRWAEYYNERPGTGKRVSSGGVNIIFSDSNTHHRGAENYRRSGEVDAMRIPKDGFFAHRVMWNGWVDVEPFDFSIQSYREAAVMPSTSDNTVASGKLPPNASFHEIIEGPVTFERMENGQRLVASVPESDRLKAEKQKLDHPVPGIRIIGHWNYEPGVKKPVYVVSAMDKVELRLNGKSLGFGERSNHFLYTWKDVEWQPGSLWAIGYASAGKALGGAEIKTAGAPASVKLTPHTGLGGLKADGADIALVDVEVVDAENHRCPTALNLVSFELSGPAEWRGGIAQGPDNYILSKTLPVECGVNRVSIRSSPQAGKIVLTASAEGLKPATVELESAPFNETHGLSAALPSDGLKASLRRGPTPAGDSVTPTRRTLQIVSASAGANADKAAASFDDNEETGWKNDDQRSTAWIQYELAQPDTVSELTMKVGGWRAKVYPIRVLVDGKEAFAGSTTRSLGYTTIPLKPTAGKTVRVELAGAITEKDAFGGVTEVAGGKLNDADAKGVRGTLEIIEAELYAPVK